MIIPNTDSSGKIIQRISDTFGKLQKNDYPAMPAGTGCRSLVQRFYALQAERVEAYRLFEEGHEAYLRTAPHYDFQRYRQLVHEITLAFSGISKELIEMKERLHEQCERPDLSEHIEKLQEKERHKLELTAKLQLAKQNVVDHPEDESGPELVQELRQKIIKTVEAISEILQDFKYDSEELA